MLTDEVGHLAITRCFGLALVGDWRAAEQARRQSKPGRWDDPPNTAAPEAPRRYFPVIPRSIAMGATGGTPRARAVLTRPPEGLVVWRPILRRQSNNPRRQPLRTPLCSPPQPCFPPLRAVSGIQRSTPL